MDGLSPNPYVREGNSYSGGELAVRDFTHFLRGSRSSHQMDSLIGWAVKPVIDMYVRYV